MIGFGVTLFALIINTLVTLNSSLNNSNLYNQIIDNFNPSKNILVNLSQQLVNFNMLIKNRLN